MSLKTHIRKWLGITDPRGVYRAKRGGFEAAKQQRYLSFFNALEAAHNERLRDLAALRAHSRDLSKNSAYMRAFIDLAATNIVGPEGIDLENNIPNREDWNDLVEAAWHEWGQCVTPDGRLSWVEFQHLAIETLVTDGEIFIRLLRGRGPFGLELELIDPDRVDHTINRAMNNGRRVIMGIEVDEWNKPCAYHIRTAHPADPGGHPERVVIPAGEILHVYADERIQSVRGIPWATPCMIQLNMLDRLWKSSLATANAEADRIGVIKGMASLTPDDREAISGENATETTATVASELTTEMATFMGIPPGMDVDFPPLRHPNQFLGEFTKFLLKGVASGLQVSYHTLAGDVAEANYSSLRAALLPERDAWRRRQTAIIAKLHNKVAHIWAEMAWLTGKIILPGGPAAFCKPIWWPRSWDWVDPLKDINSAILAINNDLSTYQEELGKRGLDWREVFRQRAAEQEYADSIGLKLPTPIAPEPKQPPTK
ncbi:MAG: phage portal protein [Holophagales bacterium]|jgi:lambda family phage portal protein|nr:phage portal protein [Holophagales bacterium]